MKLQIALDTVDIREAKAVLDEVGDLLDIIEIGTPFIIQEGIRAIADIKQTYPFHDVLADIKIMDAGDYEAKLVYDAGADIVTVLGVAADVTIQKVAKTAGDYRKKVMVDMIAVENIEQRARQIEQIGVDYICVHTASDVQEQGGNPLEELECIHGIVQKTALAVAGGIDADMLQRMSPYQPAIVIVGSTITKAQKKRDIVLGLRKAMT